MTIQLFIAYQSYKLQTLIMMVTSQMNENVRNHSVPHMDIFQAHYAGKVGKNYHQIDTQRVHFPHAKIPHKYT